MYRRFLSELYHAENAAMEGFALLSDPAYVQSSELFANASSKLVADERAHLADIEQMIALVDDDGGGVVPPDPASAAFWSAWHSGTIFALPMRPSIAATLILFAEGLGYSILYHLAEATLDPGIRALLQSNLRDEQGHLRVSMAVLRRALKIEPDFGVDLAVYGLGFALLARHPIRRQREVFAGVGFDFHALFASAIRFVRDLFALVLREMGRDAEARYFEGRLAELVCSRRGMQMLYPLSYLPEPPLLRRAILVFGQARLRWHGRSARSRQPVPSVRSAEPAQHGLGRHQATHR
jgi:hypothetical protein